MLPSRMPIENDEDLAVAVQEAGRLVQEIQNYAQRDFTKTAKLRFPRGYLRTASQARARLGFLDSSHLKSNISYTMMLSDLQHWLLVRTDLSGTAKEMVIKLQLFLLGSIVESITKVYLRGKCGGNYARRTLYLEEHRIVSAALRADLDWLWELRNRMHLFQLDNTEWLSTDYTVANHNRAVRAFKKLLDVLNAD
jgi:hypothetical protein